MKTALQFMFTLLVAGGWISVHAEDQPVVIECSDGCCIQDCTIDCCPSGDCCLAEQLLPNGCCFWDPCYGYFEIGGEALYLRPSACDLDYVIKDDRSSNNSAIYNPIATRFVLPFGCEKSVKPDYHWGFRLYIDYVTDDCGYDIRVLYSSLRTRDTATTYPSSDGLLWPTVGSPIVYTNSSTPAQPVALTDAPRNTTGVLETVGRYQTYARGRAKFDYNAVDVNLGSRNVFGTCCNLWSRVYVGLHYLDLEHRWIVHYQGNMIPGVGAAATTVLPLYVDIEDQRHIWAVGPKLGFEGRWNVWCGFGLGGQFSAALIAGGASGSFRQAASRPTANFDYGGGVKARECERHIAVIPVLSGRLGVNYTWSCNECFTLFCELGYEFNSYINAYSRLVLNDARGTSESNCQSYSLDGLYLNAMLKL